MANNKCNMCGHNNPKDNFICEAEDCGVPLDLETIGDYPKQINMEGEIRVTELNELIKESRAKVEYHESKLIDSRLQLLKQLIELKKLI